MSDDSKAFLVNVSFRAAAVSTAMQFLGPAREADAELLADCYGKAIDAILVPAGVVIVPGAEWIEDSERVRELGVRYQEHVELIAHAACKALELVFRRTLAVATRAQSKDDEG
jgi:hypothetical protein